MLIPDSSPKLAIAWLAVKPCKTSLAGSIIAISVLISEVAVLIRVIGADDVKSGLSSPLGEHNFPPFIKKNIMLVI